MIRSSSFFSPFLSALAALSLLAALVTPSSVQAADKLADGVFAAAVCDAWNNSQLPYRLGTEVERTFRGKKIEGSDWIHSLGHKDGLQKIVSGRSDCKGWAKIEWIIRIDAQGRAMCVSGGAYNGKGRTWQFVPSTANWFEFARSFGMGAFYDLWKHGMVGSKSTAWSNRAHFARFFRIAGKIGLKMDWRSGCIDLDKEATEEAVADLKKAWKIK